MKDMIDYFLKMITPPIEGAEILVAKPSEIDYESHRAIEGASLVPLYIETYHGVILLEEPTKEEADKLFQILKPGAHVVLIPEQESPVGFKGVVRLEDTGFEVRDAIYLAEKSDEFHYCSKASRSEREAGLEAEGDGRANVHPTVKPIEIMEWCARDIEPKSKVVDPFLGSGTTGVAMARLGHDFVGIELNPDYGDICEARIKYWAPIGTEIKSEAEPKEGEKKEATGQLSLF